MYIASIQVSACKRPICRQDNKNVRNALSRLRMALLWAETRYQTDAGNV